MIAQQTGTVQSTPMTLSDKGTLCVSDNPPLTEWAPLMIRGGCYLSIRTPELDHSEKVLIAMRGHIGEIDDEGCPYPDADTISKATRFLSDMHFTIVGSGQTWVRPLISSDENGHITMEWWNGHRKLTIYTSADRAQYIKVCGPNIFTDMEDGDADSYKARLELWRWLMS